ncbi:MAG: hypothetical protein HYZ14_12460 [Bacteroidetes bacterium]|nr:hypothetical protein [Bacteroidota bacterium]
MGSPENIAGLLENLIDKSTVKRRKAAIKLRAVLHPDVCKALIESLALEIDLSHWETKVELLKTIGLQRCTAASELIRKIVFSEAEYEMIKSEGALALVRLSRESLNDVSVVIEILNKGTYSAKEGALDALGYDKMIPAEENQRTIIELCRNFGEVRPRGMMDPRYGLAAACAGWSSDITKDFLELCMKTDDPPLNYVAENSLKGKYVRLR